MLQGQVDKVVEEILEASSEWRISSEVIAAKGVATPYVGSQASKAVVSAVCASTKAKAAARFKGMVQLAKDVLFKLQVILFLDSRGPPQFHEVVAAFSHNVSLVLVFIKLNECLDALCTSAFTDKEGEWFRERCPSMLTNEQMLVQFVHTMMCKPVASSEGMKQTRFMVIGTHRDLMHECKVSLAEKNRRLKELLLPLLEDELIMNGNNIIFAMNAKNPDENDQKCFHENVSDLSEAHNVKPPIASHILLNDVNRYAKEKGKKVVECGGMPGHCWEAEDGSTESGGCLDPLQPDECLDVSAIGPP